MLGVRQKAGSSRRAEQSFRKNEDSSPSTAPGNHQNADVDPRIARRFIELDCVRDLLPANIIRAIETRAAASGVGAERTLISTGTISEETYLRILAASLGKKFQTLDGMIRARCPLTDLQLAGALTNGVLPFMIDGSLKLVVAPRNVRRLIQAMRSNPSLAKCIQLTTAEHFRRFVLKRAGNALGKYATNRLYELWPALSAAPRRKRVTLALTSTITCIVLPAIVISPESAKLFFLFLLSAVFLAWIVLRLVGALMHLPRTSPPTRLCDDVLPVYTIIAALYREASSVHGLLASFEHLDYPPEKLNILLVTEEDDPATQAAIGAYRGKLAVETIVVPTVGPRTKPKALNVALPFARGTFTVVFDAEDRPEPNQLRCALHAFRKEGDNLGCVQARLSIDNAGDSWLAAMFTAEYAGHFDVFLSGMTALRLPFPLGGSSNHFRTATLRAVGGWDPYNVTEDADLGIRLARFGYRADMIDSTTFEEAPARLWPWLRQRTRWFKGWIQTWVVHMREPQLLWRDLGPVNFMSFQLLVGGSLLAALVHPIFLGVLIHAILHGAPMRNGSSIAGALLVVFYSTTAVTGYLASAFLNWRGLARRGLLSSAWVLVLTPVHWLLLSVAAWRALYQFLLNPYRWEKTEHGLAANREDTPNATRARPTLQRRSINSESVRLAPIT